MSDRTPPGIPQKKSKIGCGAVALIAIAAPVVFIGGALLLAPLFSSGEPSAPGSGSASYYCEKAVGEQLTSPDTASYESTATDDGGTWDVSGVVTSDNALGVPVRAVYNCTVKFVGDTPATTLNYIDG